MIFVQLTELNGLKGGSVLEQELRNLHLFRFLARFLLFLLNNKLQSYRASESTTPVHWWCHGHGRPCNEHWTIPLFRNE